MRSLAGPIAAIGLAAAHVFGSAAHAAEGAASNYFPGAYGSLLVAVAPEPGPVLADLTLFYSAEADRAVLQGRANANVEIEAFYSLLQGLYVWDAPAIGGRFAVGGYVSLGYASLDASLSSGLGSISVNEDRLDLGDAGLIPPRFIGTLATSISISMSSS